MSVCRVCFLVLHKRLYSLRVALSIFLTLFITLSVSGQTLRGLVIDSETTKPLYRATVVNLTMGQTTITDEYGNFVLPAKEGDILSISFTGYHTVQRTAIPGSMLRIELLPLTVQMHEYVVHDLTPFQKDSVEMTTLYSKELNKKPVKIGFSSANGGGISGLIGAPVQRLSRSYKQNKRFKKNFKNDLEQKFIDTRYTPALVTSLTGFTGDSLAIFMNTYKMDYGFARHATDLELKMWIRENYKDYNNTIHQKKQ